MPESPRSEKAEIPHPADQLTRKSGLVVTVPNHRLHVVFHELPRGLPDQEFFLAEQRINVHVIDAPE